MFLRIPLHGPHHTALFLEFGKIILDRLSINDRLFRYGSVLLSACGTYPPLANCCNLAGHIGDPLPISVIFHFDGGSASRVEHITAQPPLSLPPRAKVVMSTESQAITSKPTGAINSKSTGDRPPTQSAKPSEPKIKTGYPHWLPLGNSRKKSNSERVIN